MRWALTRKADPTAHPGARFDAPPLFLELDLLPIGLDLFFGGGLDIPVNVRVPRDQLVTDAVQDIGRIEGAGLGTEAAVEHHMEHEVADLLAHLLKVALEDGLPEFVGLLDGQVPEGFEGLLHVPRAPFPQVVHDVEQTAEGSQFLRSGVLALG